MGDIQTSFLTLQRFLIPLRLGTEILPCCIGIPNRLIDKSRHRRQEVLFSGAPNADGSAVPEIWDGQGQLAAKVRSTYQYGPKAGKIPILASLLRTWV